MHTLRAACDFWKGSGLRWLGQSLKSPCRGWIVQNAPCTCSMRWLPFPVLIMSTCCFPLKRPCSR